MMAAPLMGLGIEKRHIGIGAIATINTMISATLIVVSRLQF
jgi:hypothetical protein